jgi:ABC-2 type transport system ATP-binding protein
VLWNNLTCFEQLVFIASMYKVPRKISKIRAAELLEKMGLQEKKNKLVKTLSGGMQRRMNILMALMHDPEILILDEPEAGLDPQSRVMVREFIRSMAQSKTIVFTTHNMDEADRLCDRIAIIDHGKMLVTDTPENLKRTFGKGDKLEITFSGDTPDSESLSFIAEQVRIEGQTIFLFSKGIIEKLPAILDQLKHLEVQVTGIHLSENTLEDVFISLTGRKLRE